MSSSLNLTLTKKLRAFIDRNCGDGTLYATPTELCETFCERKNSVLKPKNYVLGYWKDIKVPLQAEQPHSQEI